MIKKVHCDYEVICEISRGTFSTVYFVKDSQDNKFALKVIAEQATDYQRAIFDHDLEFMSNNNLNHPNISQLVSVLRNVFIKLQDGQLIEIVSGALLEPY